MRILLLAGAGKSDMGGGDGATCRPAGSARNGRLKPQAESPTRTLTLEFPEEGERWWWTEDAQGKPLNAPQKTVDKQPTLQLPRKERYALGAGRQDRQPRAD